MLTRRQKLWRATCAVVIGSGVTLLVAVLWLATPPGETGPASAPSGKQPPEWYRRALERSRKPGTLDDFYRNYREERVKATGVAPPDDFPPPMPKPGDPQPEVVGSPELGNQ